MLDKLCLHCSQLWKILTTEYPKVHSNSPSLEHMSEFWAFGSGNLENNAC